MLIDTHAHLDEDAFVDDYAEVVGRALDNGVKAIVTIGTTLASSRRAIEIAQQFPSVFAVVGIQPNYVSAAEPGDWEVIEQLAEETVVVGVGETGLDRYWDFAPIDLQREYFVRHLELASRIDKPFVVHCREAEDDVVETLREFSQTQSAPPPFRGIMHSYCGNWRVANECIGLGLHISFAGMVTFKKNDALRDVAQKVPDGRLLVETDAPYLAPVPVRGKRNEPAFVRHTAECVASVRDVDIDELSQQVTRNACELFRIEPTALNSPS